MSNLSHSMRSNVSTISATESITSINSIGKKRRAPIPPKKPMTISIPEETPSMIQLENVPKMEENAKRVLPEVPRGQQNPVGFIEKVPKRLKELKNRKDKKCQ